MKQFKIFIIFLFLFYNTYSQTSGYSVNNNHRDTIKEVIEGGLVLWNGYLLNWKDFKGLVPIKYRNTNEGAEVSIRFIYKKYIDEKNNVPYVEVKVYVERRRSSVKEEAKTNYLLNHEQIHFDIAEVYARLFRKELSETTYKTVDEASKKIFKRYKYYKKRLVKYENLYDKETNHSQNKEKQEEWNKKIASLLDELRQYSNYRVNIQIQVKYVITKHRLRK